MFHGWDMRPFREFCKSEGVGSHLWHHPQQLTPSYMWWIDKPCYRRSATHYHFIEVLKAKLCKCNQHSLNRTVSSIHTSVLVTLLLMEGNCQKMAKIESLTQCCICITANLMTKPKTKRCALWMKESTVHTHIMRSPIIDFILLPIIVTKSSFSRCLSWMSSSKIHWGI